MSRKYSKRAETDPNRVETEPEQGDGAGDLGRNSLSESSRKLRKAAELARTIQHQINNPLSVVVGQVQFLLLSSDNLDDDMLGRLKKIEQAALKVARVNRELSAICELIDDEPKVLPRTMAVAE